MLVCSLFWPGIAALVWVNGMLAAIAFNREISKRLTYAFWRRWDYDRDDSKSGMQPAANLLGLAITQLVAFAVYLLRDPHPKLSVGLIYFTVSSIPIVGLAALIWGDVPMTTIRHRRGLIPRPVHAYDPASVRFAKTGLGILLFLQSYALVSYAQETFPTQLTLKKLEFLGARLEHFTEESEKKGEPKVVASFELMSSDMPDPVVIPLSQLESLPKDWEVFDVIGSRIAGGESVEPKTHPALDDSEPGKLSVVWQGLDSGVKYRLDIILYPGKSKTPPEQVIESIKAGKLLVAKAYLRNQR